MPLQPAPLATTYFRTISNTLRNLSTSVWMAYTTIFSLNLECEPMQQRWDNPPPSSTRETSNLYHLRLSHRQAAR
ncbi:hypothetical protein F5B18DRAFT_470037 [Nemania serpens]|nr:hypothetical protein F5B18DRAFT_470037 [Nemania serpens]